MNARGRCTTFVVGPDGRIFDLCVEPFPIREATKDGPSYFPINAYTAPSSAASPLPLEEACANSSP